MAWYDHEQPVRRRVEDLSWGGATIGYKRTFVAHVDPRQALGLLPARGDNLAGIACLGLVGEGITGIGVRVMHRWFGQRLANGFVELIVVAAQPVAMAGGMTFNSTIELDGRHGGKNELSGTKRTRTYHVVLTGEASLPVRNSVIDAGSATVEAKYCVSAEWYSNVIPGVYLLVCEWTAPILRSTGYVVI